MKYYQILYDWEISQEDVAMLHFDENTLGFSRYDVNTGKELGIEKIECTIEEKSYTAYDYLINDLSWLVVSEKIKKIISDSNIGNCKFIPVINRMDGTQVGYLVHCMNLLDAFDENNSLCERYQYEIHGKKDEHLFVIKYAVDSSKIGDLDIFKLSESNIPFFISDRLKKRIVASNAKGFDFYKIKS